MESTSFVALSRVATLRRQLSVIANNVANMNTTGYKSEHMMFMEHPVRSRGGERIMGDKVSYVRDISTVRDLSEGSFRETGNPLDMAIHGEGYFVVQTENGERYTRNGRFQLDDAGQLVTQQGDPVLSDGGQPFFFAPGDRDIQVTRDGTLSTANGPLGRLRIVTFDNLHELKEVSGGMFTSETAPVDAEQRDVVQNMLESSNVEPIIEMTRLIDVNRSYKQIQKMIDAEDERMKKMVRELASTTA
ncbi:MAG: flagellar basal-body rod protein FlgF [Rhodospirillales bacterium]|jgi:flagellar basal-body rod protein FlgF|nr:flagellar basal-body rod protein FlgF [Rhodospirillales bacterium]